MIKARTSPGHRGHQRNGSDFMMGGSSILSFRISFGVGLKKSKSIAVVPTSGNKIKTTKKKGFWSKMKIPTKILL
ncbi:hypothetical protein M5689_013386 [Euphorbia peplus]|nr:hypothetical protein M5689_013386 [Euphorbia peplus]